MVENKIIITDEDIVNIETLFDLTFDRYQKDVIKCLETKDIVACPGSGKTTVLLAKLAILAKKISNTNQGICVLTHTNVAIDEIKKRLGTKGVTLFEYPNFFGTFQRFVDSFLAIPASIYYFSSRPISIENEIRNNEVSKYLFSLPWGKGKLKNYLWRKAQDKGKSIEDYFSDIRLDLINERIIDRYIDEKVLLSDKKNEKYQILYSFFFSLLKRGILHYNDAYLIATKYINDFPIHLMNSFSIRFKYVLIDEMQDSGYYQNKIIDSIFDKTKVIIQKYGDPNQTIYDFFIKDEHTWKYDKKNFLPLMNSKRFNNQIAEQVNKLQLEEVKYNDNSIQMSGEREVKEIIKPVIIFYDDSTKEKVLDKFASIIKYYIDMGLYDDIQKEKWKFKAVSWVKDNKGNKDKLTIGSYWKDFEINIKSAKEDHNCLEDYILIIDNSSLKKSGSKVHWDAIIKIMLKILQLGDFRNHASSYQKNGTLVFRHYSKTSLIKELKERHNTFYSQLRENVGLWSLKLYNKEVSVIAELKTFIQIEFLNFLEDLKDNKEVKTFIEKESEFKKKDKEKKEVCGTTFNSEKFRISIDVSTIHSVKGETHTATLLLDTQYQINRESHIERLIPLLHCDSFTPNIDHIKSQKMGYVAMSRPTHLLCVTIHKDRVNTDVKEKLFKNSWKIDKTLIEEVANK